MANTPAKSTLPLILEDTYVRQDEHGRFSLNDLHQAAGGDPSIRPGEWLRNKQTVELAAEISASTAGISAIESRTGNNGGTYVARELVYAYAMWISPAFNLKVIRTFDALVTGKLGPATQPALVGKSTGLPLAQRKKLCYIRQRCLKTPRLTVKPPRQCGFVMPEFRPVLGRMGLPVRASALLNPVFSTSCPPTLENVSGL